MIVDAIVQSREKKGKQHSTKKFIHKKDGISRSIIKSISWRIVGTLDTIIISWFVTGKPVIAISIGAVELFTKMILYTLHERVWENINFGRKAVYIDIPESDNHKNPN